MGGDEVEAAVLDDGTVVEEALPRRGELFRSSIIMIRAVEENAGGAGSVGDVKESIVVIEKVAVVVDGDAVGEAVLGESVEVDREYVEAVEGSSDSVEEYCAGWFHIWLFATT